MAEGSNAESMEHRGSSVTQITDPYDPLYLHPSDNPSQILVSKVFDGNGYAGWNRAMMIALSAKNKESFVDGSFPRPDSGSQLLRYWIRCNNMVISWILNALDKDIAESVLYSTSAEEIWKDLQSRFGQVNGAQLFQIQKEICSLNQGTNSIAIYFTRLKRLWDELASIKTHAVCTCGSAQAAAKDDQDQKLVQFLMGYLLWTKLKVSETNKDRLFSKTVLLALLSSAALSNGWRVGLLLC